VDAGAGEGTSTGDEPAVGSADHAVAGLCDATMGCVGGGVPVVMEAVAVMIVVMIVIVIVVVAAEIVEVAADETEDSDERKRSNGWAGI